METVLGHDEDGRGVIERYLLDLRAQLAFYGVPRRRANRVVAESRDHLIELAAEEDEHGAVARFGSPQRIALEVARAMQPVVLFRSTLVFVGALALFVLPLYVIPENTLPPAPWDERPDYLTWKLYVSLGAFGVALPAALIAVAAAWRRRRRIALASLSFAGAALAVSAAVGAIGAVQWAQAVPGSTTTLVLSLVATACLGGVAAASLASAGRVRRLTRDLPG
ncbi:MAG: HAAS signaling domain-containing protein [Gaiellaceae bacterium]